MNLEYQLRQHADYVMDFLRKLPRQREGGMIQLDLTLDSVPRGRKIIQKSTEIVLDDDGQQFEDGAPLHPLVMEYPRWVKVFGVGHNSRRRLTRQPTDSTRAYALNEPIPDLPIFLYNSIPASTYDRRYNPVVGLARLGYLLKKCSLGPGIDTRFAEGKKQRFRKGMITLVDPVIQYTGSRLPALKITHLEKQWDAKDIQEVRRQAELLLSKLY